MVDKLQAWLIALVEMLPNLALAIILFTAFFFLARMIENFSKKQLVKVKLDQTISGFLSRLFFLIILVLGTMLALSVLQLTGTVTSILAGLGILGLALGFAFQDTAANFMSGIYITFQQPYAIGDVIETTSGVMGNVIDIDLRVTKVKTFDGPVVHVPNRYLFQEDLINYTESGRRRLRIDCGVSYGDDLEKVEKVAIEAVSRIKERIEEEEVTLFWEGFGDSSINFSVNVWLEYSRENRAWIGAKNEAIKSIKKAFDENDITIPFPIRTLDFGIKGGVQFREEIQQAGMGKLASKATGSQDGEN
ncbi:MAG: mechanosensitive ion channel family protein [Cyclobacteriaceae bacterium]